jgi:hypothetical protein
MQTPAADRVALQASRELETPLTSVEAQLAELSRALRERDAAQIEIASTALHKALAGAVEHFGRVASGS